MTRHLLVLLSVFLPIGSLSAAAPSPAPAGSPTRVFVIPVDREIDDTLAASVERRIAEARAAGADFILFDVDSPGGLVSSSIDIGDLIYGLDLPNAALILEGAYSGAALVSLAARGIVMAEGGIIGDCQPILMSPQGGYEVAGEKAQSPLRAIFRKYAERNGYPVRLAEAMVSEEMEVRRVTFFDGTVRYLLPDEVAEASPEHGGVQESKVVERADQLLTMHAREAHEFGFCGPPVKDRAEAYARLGFQEAQVTVLPETWAEGASRFLLSIKSLLFLLGIVALWMELKAPGFGIPGIIAIVAFALFFSASAIAGIAGELEVVIFVAGVGLLALEILVIPGFGLAGVAGIGCILVSLYMGSVKYAFPGGGRPWDTSGLSRFLLEFGGALLGALVAGTVVARLLPKTPIGRRIILAPAGAADGAVLTGAAATASRAAAGLVGKTGVALTTLRPAGRIVVDGEPWDAVTEGGWIDRGAAVRVYKVEGNSIVVKKD